MFTRSVLGSLEFNRYLSKVDSLENSDRRLSRGRSITPIQDREETIPPHPPVLLNPLRLGSDQTPVPRNHSRVLQSRQNPRQRRLRQGQPSHAPTNATTSSD